MPFTVKFDPTSVSKQAAIIPDATETTVGLVSLATIKKLNKGTSSVFVFRPGGVASANVYTDWAALYAALNAVQGPRVIEFDDLHDTFPCVIPLGIWNMTDVAWIGTNQSPRTDVTIGEGVFLPGLRSIIGNLDVTFTGNTPPVTDFSDFDTFFVREGGTLICNGTGPFIRVTSPISVVIVLDDGGTLFKDATPVVDLSVPGSAAFIIALPLGEAQDNTVAGALGSFILAIIGASSGTISELQPSFVGTFVPNNVTRARLDISPVITSNPGALPANALVNCDPTGGAFSLTLPAAFNLRGQSIVVKNVTTSANAITINPSGGDTIDGAPFGSIASSKGSNTYVSDGVSDWRLVDSIAVSSGPPFQDTTFEVDDAADATKKFKFDVNGSASTTTTLSTAPTVNRLQSLPDRDGDVVVTDAVSRITYFNQTAQDHGSNAGLQERSDVANRAQLRLTQYGVNAGIPGISTFKSRGTLGNLAPVIVGDVIFRDTAVGVTDNLSIPLSGLISVNVAAVPPGQGWIATDYEVQLVPKAGPANGRRVNFKVDSEGVYYARETVNSMAGVAITGPGGTILVANANVAANTRITLTIQDGGAVPTSSLYVSTRVVGASFTIQMINPLDVGVQVYYQLYQPL